MRPLSLVTMPAFSTDRLEPQWCGGDLLVQICTDDPIVVAHTRRVLLKNVYSMSVQRLRQNGFHAARAAETSGGTMCNLMGQVDGTVNPREVVGSPVEPCSSSAGSEPNSTAGTNWTARARN